MMYGSDCSGVADSMLESQRSTASANSSAMGAGKQKDVLLWHADARTGGTDPGFAAHEAPFVSIAKAAWEKWWRPDDGRTEAQKRVLPVCDLGWALGQAVGKVSSMTGSPWAVVTGPFAAVAATAQRLGWEYCGKLRFKTDVGEFVDMEVDSPKAVKGRVRRAVARWRARRIDQQLPGLELGGRPPVFAGLRAAAKAPTGKDPFDAVWKSGCSSSLRSAVCNGQWPQARLKSAGFTLDAQCQLCRASVGTLEHRRVCPATRGARGNTPLPRYLQSTFDELTPCQQKLLLNRGLLASIDLAEHQPAATDSFGWTVEPEGGLLMPGDVVYLDGSFRDGPTEDLGRTGWGFVAYSSQGKLRAAAYGVPPPWIRSIHGAEMWALFAALRVSLPGTRFRSDRKAVVDTFYSGRQRAVHASDEHARLWALIFAACDDAHDTELLWMPAHTTVASIGIARLSDGSLLSARDRSANDAADFLAKRGAATHRVPKETRKRVKLRDLLATWAARILAVATFAANNAPTRDGKGTLRDSAGLPRAARKKGSEAAETPTDGAAEAEAAAAATAQGAWADTAPAPNLTGPHNAAPTIAAPVGDVQGESSSEEEDLVLEKMGRPPSKAAKEQARTARQAAQDDRSTLDVIDAIARRATRKASTTACPSRAEATRTLVASAQAAGRTAGAADGFDYAEPEQVSHSPRSGKVERPSDTSGSEYRPRIMPQKTMASSRAADAKVTASAIAALLK